jgi:co-chaperonin GroES (HSP10)
MELKTVKTRLICTKTEAKKTTDSGIILASGQTSDEDQWATVVSIGPDVKSDIAVGDRIVPMWNTVGIVNDGSKKYFIVDEANIMAVTR